MKKALLILVFLLMTPFVSADEWDDMLDMDRVWDGQKSITNKEFEEVVDALQENSKKKEAKLRNKKMKKISGGGTSLHSELNPDNEISEITSLKPKDEGIIVNLPVNILVENNYLEKGFYKAIGIRRDNKIFIQFYQSQFLKAEIEAIETTDDYNEENIDFAKILPYNDSYVKLIFGSIDFNAYAYIPFENL